MKIILTALLAVFAIAPPPAQPTAPIPAVQADDEFNGCDPWTTMLPPLPPCPGETSRDPAEVAACQRAWEQSLVSDQRVVCAVYVDILNTHAYDYQQASTGWLTCVDEAYADYEICIANGGDPEECQAALDTAEFICDESFNLALIAADEKKAEALVNLEALKEDLIASANQAYLECIEENAPCK